MSGHSDTIYEYNITLMASLFPHKGIKIYIVLELLKPEVFLEAMISEVNLNCFSR